MIERLIDVIRAELSSPPRTAPEVEAMSRFGRDLHCDAIDMVSICLVVEDEFHIALPIEVENCETVQDMADMVARAITLREAA